MDFAIILIVFLGLGVVMALGAWGLDRRYGR